MQEVVIEQKQRRQQTDGQRQQHRLDSEMPGLHEIRAEHGHQAERDENRQFAVSLAPVTEAQRGRHIEIGQQSPSGDEPQHLPARIERQRRPA
ncbi:hypothetical protein D3C72_2043740 [compost metagenome]